MFRGTLAKLPLLFLMLSLIQSLSISYATHLPSAASVDYMFPKMEFSRGELGNVSISIINDMPVSIKLLNLSVGFDWQREIATYPEASYILDFRTDPRILASGEKIAFNIEFYVSHHIPEAQYNYTVVVYYKVPYSPTYGFTAKGTLAIRGNVSTSMNVIDRLLAKANILLNWTDLSAQYFESEIAKELALESINIYKTGLDSYKNEELEEAAYYIDLAILYAMNAYKAENDYWIREAINKISEADKLIDKAEDDRKTAKKLRTVDDATLELLEKLLDFAKQLSDIGKQLARKEQHRIAFKYANLAASVAKSVVVALEITRTRVTTDTTMFKELSEVKTKVEVIMKSVKGHEDVLTEVGGTIKSIEYGLNETGRTANETKNVVYWISAIVVILFLGLAYCLIEVYRRR